MIVSVVQLLVTQLKPEAAEAVSIVDTDCEVDFDAPLHDDVDAGVTPTLSETSLKKLLHTSLVLGAPAVMR